MFKLFAWLVLLAGPAVVHAQDARWVWLDSLVVQPFSEGLRPVSLRTSYKSPDPIRIKGVAFGRGLGLQSVSILAMEVHGHARRFTAMVGADDLGNKDIPVKFFVLGDGKVLFESGPMRVGDTARAVDVDLRGIGRVGLLVTDDVGGNNNKRTNADWADARFEMEEDHLPERISNDEARYILTPRPGVGPRINSARVFGVGPGHPLLYTIAATGQRPMRFAAEGLPRGLKLDAGTGMITGKIDARGVYSVRLKATNKAGSATMKLRIEVGDTLALTPPMGWNGFNAWGDMIDREKVLASAHAMVEKGLRDHGWVYVNIDDAWQGRRGGPMNALQPNGKFPDFGGMVGEIHSLGLLSGLYSTPYIASYGGYPGASSNAADGGETHASIMMDRRAFNHIGPYRFEKEDAAQMAAWGIDFLKYDWRMDVNSAERMSAALKASGRDVVFSLSNTAPFEHVQDWARVSNMWRTGPDIVDSWTSLYSLAFTIDKWMPYGGRGHWNDPDMMIVGKVSMGPSLLHPTRLTPDEQYSHVSLFCLQSAPLLIGCPVEQLDSFTLNLLTNDEVIAIDQDPLGRPGRLAGREGGVEVWVKPLEDGGVAVGLFNTDHYGETPASYFRWGNEKPADYRLDLARLGLKGRWMVRDVWRQQDLGVSEGSFSTSIRHHGVMLLRLTRAAGR
ncbi:MAG TPA: NPCBM/NEW2 domain-containing protein [Puia sp.]|nr:NPCBM/NEW2 domain-containing protein [Puia sp.]